MSSFPGPEHAHSKWIKLSTIDRDALRDDLLARFLRYVKIWTTSDSNLVSVRTPTTARQLDFLEMLQSELTGLGFNNHTFAPEGYLICRISGNTKQGECIGFMAHVDTSEDVSGENVQPQVWIYNGQPIVLKEDVKIDENDNPALSRYQGEMIVTSDGTTLLGSDDKSGVSALMSLACFLSCHPDWPHPDIELVFTTDEETGHGMDIFPFSALRSKICYTVDGGDEGEIEGECYNAAMATVTFKGKMVHPGYGRGRLINALSLAAVFINSLPRSESPEATDGYFGNYWAHQFSGTMEESSVKVMLRDFASEGLERRKKAVSLWADSACAAFPGSSYTLSIDELYRNMKDKIEQVPEVMDCLKKAVAMTGLDPVVTPIRGGTDGSRLTEMGIPCPNIFTGGHNFHSRREWLAVPALVRTCETLLNLLQLFSDKLKKTS
jgi:tripeptide aminopeptidase